MTPGLTAFLRRAAITAASLSLALLAWSVAIASFFWDAESLSGAFFYFDITEIN